MSRARKRSRRRRRPAPPVPAEPAVIVASPGAEERLLDLARALAGIPQRASDPRAALAASIEHLARAWQPDSPLPASVFDAWRVARADDTRALSLSFAREQVTLGLHEIFEAVQRVGHLRDDMSLDDLAWLVTAACESLAHGGDSAERARMLVAFCVAPDMRRVSSAR
jgi:hypothetical protein